MTTIELGRLCQDGSWDLIGDFATLDEVKAAARQHCNGAYHLDDDSVVFGYTEDSNGGHYEGRIGVWPNQDGTLEVVVLS